MKDKVSLIITGIIAILLPLFAFGIPVGTSPIEIISLIVFFAGMITVALVSLIKKSNLAFLISTVVYIALFIAVSIVVESRISDTTIAAIGFLPGLTLSVTGLVRNHGSIRSKLCYVLFGAGILVAAASVVLAFIAGWYI